jgi:hypothetical protein
MYFKIIETAEGTELHAGNLREDVDKSTAPMRRLDIEFKGNRERIINWWRSEMINTYCATEVK